MPVNANLPITPLPMKVRFGQQEANTKINILEEALKVELVDGPSMEQMMSFIPGFVNATWSDDIHQEFDYRKKASSVLKMFIGQTLPGALETIRFTFRVSGMTLQEVTHILRHRTATFSAVCTGDRFMYDDDVQIPEAIANSPEFEERYIELAKAGKQLYVDMVDSKDISMMDARYAMPKSSNQQYYISMNYKDLLGFVRQRTDRAIQPKGSNLIAYQMWNEAAKSLPILAFLDLVNYEQPSMFFIKTARSGHSTNLYLPEPQNDKFEYREEDFIYQKTRPELNGSTDKYHVFDDKLKFYTQELSDIKSKFAFENPEFVEILDEIKGNIQ